VTTTSALPHPVGVAGVAVPLEAGVVTVRFDGRHIWSFRPDLDGSRAGDGWFVPWPPALASYLRGSARVQVAGFDDGQTYADAEVAFDDRSARVAVVDRRGHPLMVNKVGTLSRAFDATDEATRREILEGTARILDDLRTAGRVPAYLCYGALLGALRDGRVIGHDCDTDLCYLSDHDQPADLIAESYRLERAMRERGWATTRMSGADFKVRLVLADGRSEQVDVFAAFHVGDRFYQLGNRSGALALEDVVPTSTVVLEGVTFPAPARPERMMEFLYGPQWRVPDPSFRYQDPVDGVRRLDGWLRGFRTEQPRWNRFFTSPAARRVPTRGSSFARWASARMDRDASIADVGCGNGRDSWFFAKRGRDVRSFDCSPEARVRTRRLLRRKQAPCDVRRIQLNELRTVLAEGLVLRGRTVYARQLLDSVDDEARRNLWRLARLAGGDVFVEFASGTARTPEVPGLQRALVADTVVAEAVAAGGRVVDRADLEATDLYDLPGLTVTRLHLDFTEDPR
jgi:hypothetical protein